MDNKDLGADRALVPTASSQQAVSTKGFDHGESATIKLSELLGGTDAPDPEHLADILSHGIGITQDGKRIDPADFYTPTPVDFLVEQMGEALQELSESLRQSRLLESDPIAKIRYENTVTAWRGLTDALDARGGV